jgi:hypothetical protein
VSSSRSLMNCFKLPFSRASLSVVMIKRLL